MHGDNKVSFTETMTLLLTTNPYNEVVQLIMDPSNNVRICANNGHTQSRIFFEFENPILMPNPDYYGKCEPSNFIIVKLKHKIAGTVISCKIYCFLISFNISK